MTGVDRLFEGGGEMAALMRAKDWSKTPLGPPERWPQSLRTVVRILLTSRYAMWMGWGPELSFFYNDAYRPTLGTKHAWALGASARQVWAEIWPAIGPRIDVVLQRGEATWDEGLLLFLERSGYPEETYHTFSYSPLPDDAGATGGMFCVVTEETRRVIGERRLALLRELASQLASSNTTAEVFAAVERCLAGDGRDLPFSLAYLFEDGGKRARLRAQSAMPEGHPAAVPLLDVEAEASLWPLRQVLAQGAPVEIDRLPPGLGWPRGPWDAPPVRALVLPIAQQGQARPAGAFIAGLNPYRPLDADYADFLRLFVGQVAAGLANAQAYEEERRRAEALAEIDRAKTVFFSNVSHEFRTPLTLMLGPLSDLLADPGLRHDEREQLSLMHRNGLRLLRLVNTMLEFSRIEAGRIQAAYEPLDLAEYTADLASVFRAATDKAGLRLLVDCPPLGEPVHVDADMWEKIVLNLISNAFKFTLEGEIEVSLRRSEGQVRLTVRDTGSGIPAHELPHLFERFHRVEGTPGRTHEGSGIGLALVQELVKLHGGAVQVESAAGRGSTFTVALPLGKDHLPADRIRPARRGGRPAWVARGPSPFVEEALRWLPDAGEAAAGGAAPEAGDAQAAAPGERARILLADDNADMRDYIRRLLGARWDVEAVGSGREALRAAARRRPDLVITDVMMPDLDGFGLLEQLRAGEETRDLPVIMLSARAGEEARLEGLAAGATDYLVKPFSARELVALVEAQLLRSRIRAVEDAEARRMANVFRHAPVGIALLRGPSHVFELANPPYRELVGGRDVVGKPIREALPELAGQGVFELFDEVYASGRPYIGRSFRVLLDRKGGEERESSEECFFDFVYQPMFSGGGEVEGIAIVTFEVTELAKARREAEVASRAKDEFLAMLGHELRNPLAPILTALQLMRIRNIQGGERERAVIERQVNHLVGLVDDLLDVSRITQGKVQLKKERVELSEVLAKAIEMASPLFEQHHHELRVEVPRQGLAMDADPARLAQVISNLLTNAAKYTKPGGRISVTGLAEGGEVVLRVRDNGIGIAPEMLPRIFEPFAQEGQALDRAQGGLGLGLAIVRSLVRLHDGSVSAASEGRGRGAELTVRLPRAKGDGAPGGAGRLRPASAAAARDDARRILIVDDNQDAASMLAEMLEECGYRTRCAHDGPSALEVAEAFDPDVAVLDLGLPVMDGFDLARRFGDHPRMRRTRLIAVTGYGQDQDRARTGASGFQAHLVKPVDLEELRALLERLVR